MLFAIVNLALIDVDLSFLKAVRMIRILRPLRMISRNQNLKKIVQSLINAVPDIFNVLVISSLFFMLFGILATTFFKGAFFNCYFKGTEMDVVTRRDCLNYGGDWGNTPYSFDNILFAMLTLFEMSTTEGWVAVMWSGVDAKGIDLQPVFENQIWWVFFFIFFIIVGSNFLLNLFVGVVIGKFNEQRDIIEKDFMLSEHQKAWLKTVKLCVACKPVRKQRLTKNFLRNIFIRIVANPFFDYFIMTCIIVNTAILATKFYNQPPILDPIFDYLNIVFAAIFTIEAVMKLIALKHHYFKDGWNNFDFVIVIGTIISLIISATTSISVGPQTTIIRAFRIGRIFRLVKKAKRLKMIFNSFLMTVPYLLNVGGLLFLLLFLYSVLGIYLFATIKL